MPRATYIFIDASNIRSACLKTLNLKINFLKLMQYLKKKYPNLKEARYYEGISPNDREKLRYFRRLEYVGYTVRPLVRQTYIGNAKVIRKSNVDVYLTSELLRLALLTTEPIDIVLFACDGDYAEMLKIAAENKLVNLFVVAPPLTRRIETNSLSRRLTELRGKIPRFSLANIEDIEDEIRE